MQYFTYILESLKDGRFYIGQSQDLQKRLEEHNKGFSRYTKPYRPWKLIWQQSFNTRKEAYQLEQKLKTLKSRERLIKFISKG
ncbi:GIY-YIG nuclease family protein [Psychroflexus sediminis]|uniref:GIY-YIG nuclease family protein n=1 Tax=Psychroflexus sediminis TaxID=470826 RepID=UPI000B85DF28|nr:GIY-YIG nuclease family protein [Psychroflexus sediminis]